MKNQKGVVSNVLMHILTTEIENVEQYLEDGWIVGIVIDFRELYLSSDIDLLLRVMITSETEGDVQEFVVSGNEGLGRFDCNKISEALKSTIYRDEKYRIVALKIVSDERIPSKHLVWYDLDHFKILGKVQIDDDGKFGSFEWYR